LGSLSLLAVACGSEADSTPSGQADAAVPVAAPSDEVDPHDSIPALIELEFAEGQVVSFHEMNDVILVSERARNGTPPVLGALPAEPRSATQTFELLRPGQAIPSELREAVERANLARANVADLADDLGADVGGGSSLFVPPARSNGVGTTSEAITADTFLYVHNGCGPWPVSNSWSVCYPDWANGFYAYNKARRAVMRVASKNGSFQVKIDASTGGQGSGIYYVAHDTYREFRASGEPCCALCPCLIHARTMRIDVIDAIGKEFHVGGVWWW
jgi:hypothetical protein